MRAWTPEEDQTILAGIKAHGRQWSIIKQSLPGRTVSSTRNRYNRIENGRRLEEAGFAGRNRCLVCGQRKRGHVCLAKLGGGPQVVIKHAVAVVAPSQACLEVVRSESVAPQVQKSISNISMLGLDDICEMGVLGVSDTNEWSKADNVAPAVVQMVSPLAWPTARPLPDPHAPSACPLSLCNCSLSAGEQRRERPTDHQQHHLVRCGPHFPPNAHRDACLRLVPRRRTNNPTLTGTPLTELLCSVLQVH